MQTKAFLLPLKVSEAAKLIRHFYYSMENNWTKIHVRTQVQTRSLSDTFFLFWKSPLKQIFSKIETSLKQPKTIGPLFQTR